jgi:predicted Zn-dependent peptidase
VDAARRYAIGSLVTSTASQSALASILSELASQGLGPAWLRQQPERLAAVTVEDVAQAAVDFFPSAAFSGVVVGDGELLAEPLHSLGGVELPGL